jgi:hypothetical protein
MRSAEENVRMFKAICHGVFVTLLCSFLLFATVKYVQPEFAEPVWGQRVFPDWRRAVAVITIWGGSLTLGILTGVSTWRGGNARRE